MVVTLSSRLARTFSYNITDFNHLFIYVIIVSIASLHSSCFPLEIVYTVYSTLLELKQDKAYTDPPEDIALLNFWPKKRVE